MCSLSHRMYNVCHVAYTIWYKPGLNFLSIFFQQLLNFWGRYTAKYAAFENNMVCNIRLSNETVIWWTYGSVSKWSTHDYCMIIIWFSFKSEPKLKYENPMVIIRFSNVNYFMIIICGTFCCLPWLIINIFVNAFLNVNSLYNDVRFKIYCLLVYLKMDWSYSFFFHSILWKGSKRTSYKRPTWRRR